MSTTASAFRLSSLGSASGRATASGRGAATVATSAIATATRVHDERVERLRFLLRLDASDRGQTCINE